jgi:Ca2+-binding RTX toxin-like protein
MATPLRSGAEFIVNTTLSGNQVAPATATLADGRFVVAWMDASGSAEPTLFDLDVRAQVFNPDGTPSGSELLVNTTTSSLQRYPSIAGLGDGGFVAIWYDESVDGGGVRGQIFSADGSRVGGELVVPDVPGRPFDQPHFFAEVLALKNGRFVVMWTQEQEGSGNDVFGQIFEPDGTRVGTSFVANSITAGHQRSASATALPDGGFLFTWVDSGQLPLEWSQTVPGQARAQRFAADGTRVGGEFDPTPAAPYGTDMHVSVAALNDGRLGFSWVYSSVMAQVLTADGTASTPAASVAASSVQEGLPPDRRTMSVALANGGFLVLWDNLPARIGAQLVKGDGSFAGGMFLADSGADRLALAPDATALEDGKFVVVWSGTDGRSTPGWDFGQGIKAQIYRVDMVPPSPPTISGTHVEVERVVVTGSAEAGSVVQVLDENQTLVGSGVTDASGVFLVSTAGLPDGTHVLTAIAMDENQNVSAPTAAVPVTIQVTFYSDATTVLGAQSRHLVLLGAAEIDGTGNALDNCLVSNDGANVLAGAAGNDVYVIHQAADLVVENAAEGIDVVQAEVSFVLPENVESVMLRGSLDLDATGNSLDNVLVGNPGVNVLTGGAGNDIYLVQQSEDRVVERADEGIDVVNASASFTLPDHVESLVLEGSAFFGIGNALANVLVGNDMGNTLIGAGGADLLNGGGGNDVYGVDDALDTVYEEAAAGTDSVVARVSYVLPANVEILDLVGGATEGHGHAKDNTINGNEGANLLSGGGGYDQLHGGAGDDTVSGGAGIDAVWGGTGRDTFMLQGVTGEEDLIADFTPGEDTITLSGLPFANGGAVNGVSFIAGGAIPASISGPIVLYETTTQALIYDSNGAQQDGRTLLAILVGVPELSAADLLFA